MKSVRAILNPILGTTLARSEQSRFKSSSIEANFFLDREHFKEEPREDNDANESPIFICSAGWRCGSTLLQRLICSGGDILIWGEPYDRCSLVQRLAEAIAPISNEWPPDEYIINSDTLSGISQEWIANLYPQRIALKNAYRKLLLTLYSEPAKSLGAARWGVKEVRYGRREVLLLHWLFPEAKFLFIDRDIYKSFESYAQVSPFRNWYERWPEKGAFTAYSYSIHHFNLMDDFEKVCKEVGGLRINYEELIAGQVDIGLIEEYCGLRVDASILNYKIQGTAAIKNRKRKKLGVFDRLLIKSAYIKKYALK